MEMSKEQAIKDLQIENSTVEVQEQIVGAFFRSLQAKVQLELSGRLSDEQKEAFSAMDQKQQDSLMEEAAGGDLDAFVDEMYKESVDEFHAASNKIADEMNKKDSAS